jgi:hypothetical protein
VPVGPCNPSLMRSAGMPGLCTSGPPSHPYLLLPCRHLCLHVAALRLEDAPRRVPPSARLTCLLPPAACLPPAMPPASAFWRAAAAAGASRGHLLVPLLWAGCTVRQHAAAAAGGAGRHGPSGAQRAAARAASGAARRLCRHRRLEGEPLLLLVVPSCCRGGVHRQQAGMLQAVVSVLARKQAGLHCTAVACHTQAPSGCALSWTLCP